MAWLEVYEDTRYGRKRVEVQQWHPDKLPIGVFPVFTAPQPAGPVVNDSLTDAEPVKVPSDDEIISLAREYGGCFARSSRMLQFDFEQPGILNFARALLSRYGRK